MIQDDSVSIPSGVMQFNKSRSAAMRKCIQKHIHAFGDGYCGIGQDTGFNGIAAIRSETHASCNHLATRIRLAFKSRSITQVETAYK
jgi:hypothetical protein